MGIAISEILIIIAGIVYGYTNPGKQNRADHLKYGFIFGFILGGFFGLIQNLSINYTIALAIVVSAIIGITTFVGRYLKDKIKN